MSLAISLKRAFSYFSALITYKKKLALLLGINVSEINNLFEEINSSVFMQEILSKAGSNNGFLNLGMSCVLRAPSLYVICRVTNPDIVVETGVANGFSSAFILNAIKRNNKGHLYSIDLPNQPGQEISCGLKTGWLVPEELTPNWTLIIGSSKEKLPPLLAKLGKLDIFYHDSDHSYENMMFEFNQADSHLGKNNYLIADDITDNRAFRDFSNSIKASSVELFKLGIIRK